jgi:tetratricopeptide (TPR) repeat protein
LLVGGLSAAAVLLTLGSYLAFRGSPNRVVRIETEPAGAEVAVDGKSLGASPVSVTLKRTAVTVSAELLGYRAASQSLAPEDGPPVVTLRLQRLPLVFTIFVDPPEAALSVGGVTIPGAGRKRTVEIPASEGADAVDFTAEHRGYTPQTVKHRLGPNERREVTLRLERAAARPFKAGEEALAAGDLAAAIRHLTAAVEADPDDLSARRQRALAQYRAGDWGAAVTDCNWVLAKESGDATAAAIRAAVLLETRDRRDHASVRKVLERVTQADHGVPLLDAARAALALAEGRTKEATEAASAALAADPACGLALVVRGEARRLGGNPTAAKRDLDEALRLCPKGVLARAARAELHLAEKQYAAAIADADEVVQATLRQGNKDTAPANMLVVRARANAAIGKDAEALWDGRRVVREGHGSVELCVALVGSARTLGRTDDLAEVAGAWVRVAPRDGRAYAARAEALLAKNDYPGAVRDCARAVQLRETSALVFQTWVKAIDARTAAPGTDPKAAAAELQAVCEKWLQGHPNSPSPHVWRARAEVLLAEAAALNYSPTKEFVAAARRELDDALYIDQRSEEANEALFRLHLRFGNRADAIKAATDAIDRCDNPGVFYYLRSHAHRRAAAYGKMIADLEQCLQYPQKDERAYNELAWNLATCPDASCRNGRRAVELAEKGVELALQRATPPGEVAPPLPKGTNPFGSGGVGFDPTMVPADAARPVSFLLDTLAAAHAETGQYDKAIAIQQLALQLFNRRTDTPDPADSARTRRDWGKRLKLYQQGQPYHED